ncbi:F0F1 ATP synthase subunit epsilon [Aporhodopirellula aestuarii]|uniref:ATP synthase epsilon chain n=1 Tax=Aporhodopirellula aestuarii TaxID=2950107 RepID=A0ABT0U6J8_9BACT|nr:hypothetical protein [Aporhodopirellula aestuarii]MCM2372545.1 hypothetical protein [Aporhodopirellula aestuarii]
MSQHTLHVIIRTPREVVAEMAVVSMRVPTQSGQVGVRPRGEANVLAIEPGLISFRLDRGMRYAGTAGGLLHASGDSASLLTPIAVVADDVDSVSRALDELLDSPSEEMDVRRAMGRLESRILQELHLGEEVSDPQKGKP